MTWRKRTIMEMAKECDLIAGNAEHGIYIMALERFAKLVREEAIAEKRKACERAVEELLPDADRGDCAAELRRLHEENQMLLDALKSANCITASAASNYSISVDYAIKINGIVMQAIKKAGEA